MGRQERTKRTEKREEQKHKEKKEGGRAGSGGEELKERGRERAAQREGECLLLSVRVAAQRRTHPFPDSLVFVGVCTCGRVNN
eukprot:644159-Pleurochrysis_carterae.AAC.1